MKKFLSIILVLLLCFGIFGCGENNKADPTDGTDTSVEPTEKYYFQDDIAVLEDIKIEITDHKVINPGKKGNEYGEKPVLAFWYKVTNTSDKDIDPISAWLAVFVAIQDNDPNSVNELNVGTLPDEKYLDSQMEQIKEGGTVENAISYELDDTKTPVVLKATKGIDGKELGEQTYNLK
ncbi:MAG: DUF5067 domain-containing protein [Clostridiales Family XIII bacterium]|uniref:DUF5067 domain-containing protein n=2 Tax=Bacteria TaxID=2 RepID=A0A9J6QVY1_9FIRM|nr:DUF5067 domain-containing protein [Hominibacterium faecale]MCI7304072.1 DUF5067 domain-containing protein [Clostridia bacterium]MCU7379755.1 DUF5067 domain-containing protein [Hominibacterium faecale]MDY3011722.1 DUF5067 domain-containing protein [Clostridiales Family XIII bacterium]